MKSTWKERRAEMLKRTDRYRSEAGEALADVIVRLFKIVALAAGISFLMSVCEYVNQSDCECPASAVELGQ